jgi:hypothetical protein
MRASSTRSRSRRIRTRALARRQAVAILDGRLSFAQAVNNLMIAGGAR